MKRLLFVFPFGLLLACSADASSEGAAQTPEGMFAVAPAASADASQVTGIWEVAQPTRLNNVESRIRFELRADHVIAAARCGTTDGSAEPVVAGARVTAAVTDAKIEVGQPIEAKKQLAQLAICGVKVAAGTLPRCAAETKAEERKMCFALEDAKLTLYQASGPVTFTKVAD